jgi:hypothetical protein
MAKLNKIMPPRNTKIRGQDHLLAYITPEEAALLKARGGSGEAGPMGIPAFAEEDGDDDDVGGNPGDGGGIGGDDAGTAGGPGGGSSDGDGFSGGGGGMNEGQNNTGISDAAGINNTAANVQDAINDMISANAVANALDAAISADIGDYAASDLSTDLADALGATGYGMSPGDSQAQFGTPEFAGLSEQQAQGLLGSGQASQQAMDVQSNIASQQAAEIATLEQLNKDLYDLSRREQYAKSLPGLAGLIAAKNVRNLAASMAGYPPGVLSGINVFSGNTIGPGLAPSALAGLQSRGIRGATGKDPFGRETTGIVGFRDAYGNLAYGRDPNEPVGEGRDPRDPIKPADPETGQCEEGYMFDEDMQACRLDTRSSMGGQPRLPRVPFAPGGYARMGLLDEAPTNLPQFQQRYGAGFGTPSEFAAANRAFRQQGAYRPEYFKRPYPTDGYTLLG